MSAGAESRSSFRFAKLGYVAINVSDIQRSRDFYEMTLGLQVSEIGPAGEVSLRCSEDHHNIILYPSERAGLRRLGWQMESEDDLDRLVSALDALGLEPVAVDDAELGCLRQGRSFRIVEPFTGALTEFYAHQSSDFAAPFVPTVAKIQRLGHVVLTTPRYEEAVDFYERVLNFRVSDTIGERVTFMRCFPNPYHHSLGIGSSVQRGFHHINFMVSEIDDIGKAFWRFQKNDAPILYGPGRHPPSDSVFLYASDPDGITVEYSYGMEEFPEVAPREPRPLPNEQSSSDTWGGPPPRIKAITIEADGDFPRIVQPADIA